MAIEKIQGIVTDVRKYSDRHNIVTLFTRDHGRLSLLSSTGSAKSARIRNASLMPLSVISADINFNATREIQFLGAFTRDIIWRNIYFDPIKSAVSLFLTEFINTYFRVSPPEPKTWDYILYAINFLDNAYKGLANFHLAFLIEFLPFAGIQPDLSDWREESWFDMRGGTMTVFPPRHRDYLHPSEVWVIPLLARLNLRTATVFKFNADQRRRLLRGLLHYYSLHYPGISNMKSPEVLAEVFS